MRRNKVVCNLVKFSLLVMVTLVFGSCLKSGSSSNTNTNNLSFVTLMNMAPYSSATEVYFNNLKQTSSVAAGAYSGSYAQIPPGAYDVQFKVAGSDSVLSDIPLSPYDSLGFYTLVMYNPTTSNTISSVKITDDFSTLQLTYANYRFFNFCPEAPSVDLYFNSTVQQTGRSVGDFVYGSSYTSFAPCSPGSYSITAKKSGTDSVIATISAANLTAANAYTIFLMGSTKNSSNPISLNILMASY